MSTEGTVLRFHRSQRLVHRSVAVLTGVCIATAAVLYNGSLASAFGHRRLIQLAHVGAGIALPVPILLGLLSPAFRADLRRLNRFTRADRLWLRSRRRRDGTIRVGKFNAGQKLNAALSAGSILVLLGTGILMNFTGLVRLDWRTGATFVHDWFALGLGLLVLGHLWFAAKDPLARTGMRTGQVPAEWARAEHPAWAQSVGPDGEPRRTSPG
jgi:formate dehydrogenase subunit gamma